MINESKQAMQVIDVILTTRSPIHIGCDEIYDPISYKVGDGEILVYDPLELARLMDKSQRKELSKLLLDEKINEKNGIKKVCDYIQKLNVESLNYKKIGIAKEYKKEYENAKSYDQFVIDRTAFLKKTGKPYIPGSSVKGSLRTAYLNLIADKENKSATQQEKNKDSKGFECRLLNCNKNETETDPFRLVKVSDFLPIGDIKTKIVYLRNFKKKNSGKNLTSKQRLEVIPTGSKFLGQITIMQPIDNNIVKKTIDKKILFNSTNRFYGEMLTNLENRPYYIDGRSYQIKLKSAIPNDEYPMQIGRHSGAEGVTIKNSRSIEIGQIKKSLSGTTTIWCANETYEIRNQNSLEFYSWASLKELSLDEMKKLSESIKKEQAKMEENLKQEKLKMQEILKEREKEELAQKKIEEEQKKIKEEQEKQIANMPDDLKKIVDKCKYANAIDKTYKSDFRKQSDKYKKILAPFFIEAINEKKSNIEKGNGSKGWFFSKETKAMIEDVKKYLGD
ncbi:MAG: type III-A CRISPR-associated RAMP protein Csm5 [Bdellovibrionota bacterium]